MSDPGANGPVPGGGRLVNRARLSLKETQARLDAWFFERLAQPDESFWEHLLSYVIGMFDNVATVDLVLVKVYQDIEASYVPYLQSRVDPLLNIVRAYAQQDLSGSALEVYLLKVETRLDARIQHWTAEALHKIGELESVDSVPSGQSQQPKVAPSSPDAAAVPLVCRNLALLREKTGLSFRKLAEAIETYDHQAVAEHCRGRREPEDFTLAKYARVFSRALKQTITSKDLRSIDFSKLDIDQ